MTNYSHKGVVSELEDKFEDLGVHSATAVESPRSVVLCCKTQKEMTAKLFIQRRHLHNPQRPTGFHYRGEQHQQ
jgi:hypothetical protein